MRSLSVFHEALKPGTVLTVLRSVWRAMRTRMSSDVEKYGPSRLLRLVLSTMTADLLMEEMMRCCIVETRSGSIFSSYWEIFIRFSGALNPCQKHPYLNHSLGKMRTTRWTQ
jgi:hypothetical protein